MAAYARQAVARSGAGFTISGNAATLTSAVSFPAATSGSTTATHFVCGRASSGAGAILFFGTITPNITIVNGVTPQLSAATNITQASSDALANTSATNLLLLIFNNTTWANIGDATGIVGSTTAGSLYLGLHTASPGETGDQTTSEVSYS